MIIPETDREGIPKRTRSQAQAIYRVSEALQRLEYDLHYAAGYMRHIPSEWGRMHRAETGPKTRVTTRIDNDILRYFKAQGPGYQRRINDVLRAFVCARAARFVEEEADITRERDRYWAKSGAPDPIVPPEDEA